MKKKSTWFIVNRFFAPKKGRIVTRKELIAFQKRLDLGPSVENYRCYLMRAGFLKSVGLGKYKVVRAIPASLSSTELYELAYPPKPDVENHGRICFRCAEERRWKWPKNHVATACYETCPYCDTEGVSCVATTDWIRVPKKKQLSFWEWD